MRCALVLALVACDAGVKTDRHVDQPAHCVAAPDWLALATHDAPPASDRLVHVAIGDRLLVVGGNADAGELRGALLDPCTNTWSPIDTSNMPRQLVMYGNDITWQVKPFVAGHRAVWLYPGTYGSMSPYDSQIAAAIFDADTRTWKTLPLAGALARPRTRPALAWTGKELLLWGGLALVKDAAGEHGDVLGTGVAIDLASGTTRPLSTQGAPSPRSAAATGFINGRMIVWGGCSAVGNPYVHGECTPLADGARYDPATDRWSAMSAQGAPGPRGGAVVRVVDDRLVVAGGLPYEKPYTVLTDGAQYDATHDAWLPYNDVAGLLAYEPAVSLHGVRKPPHLDARQLQVTEVIGKRLIVWGSLEDRVTGVSDCSHAPPHVGCDPAEIHTQVPRAEGWLIDMP